jgi:rSAM/selenodomain-associated transferase 2
MRISIIIPTVNEAAGIAETIGRTRALGECEIIVVDGGSEDGTCAAASSADQCLTSPRGRAVQLNRGAAASRGDVLLFLHADCWLEPGGLQVLQRTLADVQCVGGCFRQRIEAEGFGYRLIEAGNAWRVRLLKWAYGDQAIFVRRSVIEKLGGFPEIPLMEDLFFMKRLKREGRIALVDHPLHVSPRRWQRHGLVPQTLRNWGLITLAHCGVSPHTLAHHYADVR